MNFQRKLPIPKDVKAEYPLTEKMIAEKAARDKEIADVFEGASDKFILIICCVHHRLNTLSISVTCLFFKE